LSGFSTSTCFIKSRVCTSNRERTQEDERKKKKEGEVGNLEL